MYFALWFSNTPVRPSFFLHVMHLFFLGFLAGLGPCSGSSSPLCGVFLGLISDLLHSSVSDDGAALSESAVLLQSGELACWSLIVEGEEDDEVVDELEMVDDEG